ncbi:GTP-binding protein [Rhodococcus sp. NPDC058521]|uniref:GTP-binding protein n=1 Tax=Rhodococcus sp. NPDC058521 TaxID=3346536 RepID=UPI0036609578
MFGVSGPTRRRLVSAIRRSADRPVLSTPGRAHDADVAQAAASFVRTHAAHPGGLVIECPDYCLPPELISEFAASEYLPGDEVDVATVVTVVDAVSIRSDLTDAAPAGFSSRALVTVGQIEYASVLAVVNWEDLPRQELTSLLSMLSHLSPTATIRIDSSGTNLFDGDRRVYREGVTENPGWVRILNGELESSCPFGAFASTESTPTTISSLRYEQVRPLHPHRLARALHGLFEEHRCGRVIRSAGFCHFATRHGVTAQWSQVGGVISFEPLARDGVDEELLAVGQDIAFIGVQLDRSGLIDVLDACALRDDELRAGPAFWDRLTDPFPRWHEYG